MPAFLFMIGFIFISCNGGNGGDEDADVTQEPDADMSDADIPDTLPDPDADLPDEADTITPDGEDGIEEPIEDVTGDELPDDRPCTLGGDECEEGEKCTPQGPGESLVCRPAGTAAVGDECGLGGEDDCVAGAVCVPYDDDTSLCALRCTSESGDVPCPEDYQVCVPWFGPGGSTAGICLGDDCTPPADGCGAGERCSVILDVAFACLPAGGVPFDGDCSTEECEAGLICRDTGEGLRCHRFCENASDCLEEDTHCIWPWQDFTDWGYCMPGCDPVRGTGCETGEGCYFMDPETGSMDCWTAGDMGEGEDCSSMSELCVPGLDCILQPDSDPFEYYCRAYCDDEHPCATGTCQSTTAMPLMKVCIP